MVRSHGPPQPQDIFDIPASARRAVEASRDPRGGGARRVPSWLRYCPALGRQPGAVRRSRPTRSVRASRNSMACGSPSITCARQPRRTSSTVSVPPPQPRSTAGSDPSEGGWASYPLMAHSLAPRPLQYRGFYCNSGEPQAKRCGQRRSHHRLSGTARHATTHVILPGRQGVGGSSPPCFTHSRTHNWHSIEASAEFSGHSTTKADPVLQSKMSTLRPPYVVCHRLPGISPIHAPEHG
jgi:hypothetical protein